MAGGYLFALLVTSEQENAIRNLYVQNGWTLIKAGFENKTRFPHSDDEELIGEKLGDGFGPHEDMVTKAATIFNGIDTSTETLNTDSASEIICNYSNNDRFGSSSNLQSLISRGKLLSLSNKKKQVNSIDRLSSVKLSQRRLASKSKSYICKKRSIFCRDCKITFTSQSRYDKHKERNGGKCVFVCEFCDKVFLYRKSRYDLHVRSAHTKERPFTCDICGKGYVTSDKLKIHKRQHTGEKPCVCEECGKTFSSRGNLAVHRDYHHDQKVDDIQCDICHKTFRSKRYLLYHQRVTHNSAKDFHCQKCSKSFKCNSSLKRHLKYIHSDVKELQCQTCNKTFKTEGSLKKHSIRHSGEKKYFCNECNKGFYEKFKLLLHYRVHTGEKPYKCDLCDFKCALSENLSKHKKTHYKELTNAVL